MLLSAWGRDEARGPICQRFRYGTDMMNIIKLPNSTFFVADLWLVMIKFVEAAFYFKLSRLNMKAYIYISVKKTSVT